MKKVTVLFLGAVVALTLSGAESCGAQRPAPEPPPATDGPGEFGQSPGDTMKGQRCTREGQERTDHNGRTVVCTRNRSNGQLWWWDKP